MQRIKDTLLRNSNSITTGLGLLNLWVWVVHDPSLYFLFLGLSCTGLGLLGWAAEVNKDAIK